MVCSRFIGFRPALFYPLENTSAFHLCRSRNHSAHQQYIRWKRIELLCSVSLGLSMKGVEGDFLRPTLLLRAGAAGAWASRAALGIRCSMQLAG
jgi:hypothetical protein